MNITDHPITQSMNITASKTRENVRLLTPHIQVLYNLQGEIDVAKTAERFVEANYRHVVNRRLQWSATEQFVRMALSDLLSTAFESYQGINSDGLRDARENMVNLVRTAANRRKAWTLVSTDIVHAVMVLIFLVRDRKVSHR